TVQHIVAGDPDRNALFHLGRVGKDQYGRQRCHWNAVACRHRRLCCDRRRRWRADPNRYALSLHGKREDVMGINFPSSPTNGQIYPLTGQPQYVWDAATGAWKAVSGTSVPIYVSDTAPTGVPDKSLWFKSDTGQLYIRYNDGNSSQWVFA